MTKKWIWLFVAATFLAGLAAYGLRENAPVALERVVVTDVNQVISALMYIASAEGYFHKEGLSVEFLRQSSGKESIKAVLEGKADIATSTDSPLAVALMAGNPIKIFTSIHASDKTDAIAALRDKSIAKPADLIGKRIGMIPGTSSELFLKLFLTDKRLLEKDITIVPLEADKLVDALTAGSIDAMSGWQSLRLKADKSLPGKLETFFCSEGLFTTSWALSARADFLTARPETTQKFLRALLAAESFAIKNHPQAVQIVAKHTNLPLDDVDRLWEKGAFNVRLDQALLLSLESSIKSKQPAAGGTRPDVLAAFYWDALKTVNSSRVTLIH